jgi:hypothetical protein
MEKSRYFVFQVLDLYTFKFDYIGSRTTGNDGGTYLIVGPGWKGARATGTQMGIGANSRDKALYPILDKDADGQPLDGSKGKYTLHFGKGQFPPVNSFWSLTMYNLPSQLLVKNRINRYLINSPMLPQLKLDPDGGLTIYIRADTPGVDSR